MDILEFNTARLDEDEAYALEAAAEFGPDWTELWSGTVDLTGGHPDRHPPGAHWETVLDTHDARVSRYMVHFDPARVMCAVEQKRQTLRRHAECDEYSGYCGDGGKSFERELGGCGDLRAIAMEYQTHADFSPRWLD